MKKEDILVELYRQAAVDNDIPAELYPKYDVKKGLRNENKTGVLVGLTRICDVVGYEMIDGKKVDIPGRLYYRGIEIKDIVANCDFKPGTYEEVCYLLVFGSLPTKQQYDDFCVYLRENYQLPDTFLNSTLLKLPAQNMMNKIQRALLVLYEYDFLAEDISVENTLIQGLNIVAHLPTIVIYSYLNLLQTKSGITREMPKPNSELGFAESILYMLREDHSFTKEEAELLDIIMTIHADHGGGNNSTFANVVVASTDTDLYSALAAAVGSLKGPKHGGANEKVCAMMSDAILTLGLKATADQMKDHIAKLLNREGFDNSGLFYGIGHAVYTISDPRAELLFDCCQNLASSDYFKEKLAFYQQFANVAIDYLQETKGGYFCANVDFYSGLAYEMLAIPSELYLPIFAISRTIGWLAHNLENKLYSNRIIRPATKFIGDYISYTKLEERKQ